MPPYRIFRSFLPDDLSAALLDWALNNEAAFEPTTVGDNVHNPNRRLSLGVNKFGPVKQELRGRILDLAPALISDLKIARFEIASTELELVAHNDGAFFVRHIDTITGDRSKGSDVRVLSAVYYIFGEPKAFTGGALRLYRFGGEGEAGDMIDIEPEPNMLVVFPSWASHEVRPVACPSKRFADSRFAVNIWICGRGPDR